MSNENNDIGLNKRIDRIEMLVAELVTAVGLLQGTHSPEVSGNTAGEVSATRQNKLHPEAPACFSNIPYEPFPNIPAETSAIVLETPPDKSDRNATTQADAQEHPLEKSFWEEIEKHARSTARKAVHRIVSETLLELRKRSILTD